jgi:hypothetical protein
VHHTHGVKVCVRRGGRRSRRSKSVQGLRMRFTVYALSVGAIALLRSAAQPHALPMAEVEACQIEYVNPVAYQGKWGGKIADYDVSADGAGTVTNVTRRTDRRREHLLQWYVGTNSGGAYVAGSLSRKGSTLCRFSAGRSTTILGLSRLPNRIGPFGCVCRLRNRVPDQRLLRALRGLREPRHEFGFG